MVDITDLKSVGLCVLAGSSPAAGTTVSQDISSPWLPSIGITKKNVDPSLS